MTTMLVVSSSPFGSGTRTGILLALHSMEESYPRELTRILGIRLSAVQGALRSLERDGLVASRTVGRTRLTRLNPRYFAYRELRGLLARLAEPSSTLKRNIESLRRRPRRTGKPA